MKKYIDADKFISYLGFENTEEERDENVGKIVTLQDFDNQITEDVQEVKHGKWEEIRDAYGKLEGWIHTECGREVKIKENFCPYCGAKMDRKDDENT